MSDHLKIWNRLSKTDPSHTKPFNRAGGFKGTAVKPIYTEHKMTELFGPCGVGWGVNEPSFNVVPGSDGQVAVYCTVSIWYKDPDTDEDANTYHQPVYGVGGDMVVVKQSNGLRTDDEAFKKAFTDAVGNAMKHIGMSADVHMGQFDDSKYVQERRDEEREAKRIDAIPKLVEVTSGPAKPKEAAISSAAIGFAREMKSCLTLQDLDAFKRTPEFKTAWGAMNEVDRKHIIATGEQLRAKLTVSDILMAGE